MIWDVEREIISFGPLALRWYSLLFALGFVIGYFIMQNIFRKEGKPEALLDSILFHAVIGTIVGARLGHCLFYEPAEYLANPLRILMVWEGGLASHGGFLGVILALLLVARKHARDIPFFWLCDRMAIPTMMTAGFIRLGNLFNSEILGRAADVPWAVVFKKVDNIPRHPTQIYEAAGYLAISLLLFSMYRLAGRKPLEGRLMGVALSVSFAFRIWVEQFKENQVPFEDGMWLNMGQLLSIPFILFGIFLITGWHHRLKLFRPALSQQAGPPRQA